MSSLGALVWGAPGAREFVSVVVSVSVGVGRRRLPRPTQPRPSHDPPHGGPPATHPEKKNKQNSEDPSGSIRDITAHLINDKNTWIAETCIVFNGKSAGNNPRWIYWSYEFLFFRPWGLRTRRPAQTGPRGQNPAFQRFDPMILCSFLWRIRWTTLENHRTKQLMDYEQIISFIKHLIFFGEISMNNYVE